MLGRPWEILIPALQENGRELVNQAVSHNTLIQHEFAVTYEDGSVRNFSARFVRCGEHNAVVMVQDSTADLQARETLERHSISWDHTWDGVVITNLAGKITDCNPSTERIFGYARESILNQSLSTLFSPHDRATFNRRVADTLAEEGQWTGTETFVRRDGSEGICEVRYLPLSDENGNLTSIIGVNREIMQEQVPVSTEALWTRPSGCCATVTVTICRPSSALRPCRSVSRTIVR